MAVFAAIGAASCQQDDTPGRVRAELDEELATLDFGETVLGGPVTLAVSAKTQCFAVSTA